MNKHRRLAPFWTTLIFGLLSLFSMISKPSFAGYRPVDVVQMIATGMCFGVALATLVVFLKQPPTS